MEQRNPTGALESSSPSTEVLKKVKRGLEEEISSCRDGAFSEIPSAIFDTLCICPPIAGLGVTIGAGIAAGVSYLTGSDPSYIAQTAACGALAFGLGTILGSLALFLKGGDEGLWREDLSSPADPEKPETFLSGWDRIEGAYSPRIEIAKRKLRELNNPYGQLIAS